MIGRVPVRPCHHRIGCLGPVSRGLGAKQVWTRPSQLRPPPWQVQPAAREKAGLVDRLEEAAASSMNKYDLGVEAGKRRLFPGRIISGEILIRPERHPARRQYEARSGSGAQRENLAFDPKGKGPSGYHREAASTNAPSRGGLPHSKRCSDCSGRGAKPVGARIAWLQRARSSSELQFGADRLHVTWAEWAVRQLPVVRLFVVHRPSACSRDGRAMAGSW